MVSRIYTSDDLGGMRSKFSDDLETFYMKNGLGPRDVRAKIDALTELMPGTLQQTVTYHTERLEEIERDPQRQRFAKPAEGGRVRIVGPREDLDSVDTSKILLETLEISYNICRGACSDRKDKSDPAE